MIPRRFLNLVSTNLLSRMRPDENLFYSSVEEAAAQQAELTRRGKHKPVSESAMELASPEFRFTSSRVLDSTLTFLPFYGGLAGDQGSNKVVVVDSGGGSLLYDAHDGSAEILPPMPGGGNFRWLTPISLCVTSPNKNALRPDSLYAINRPNSSNFMSLAYCSAPNVMAWQWHYLPCPPYVFLTGEYPKHDIQSHTVLADGKTICFSGAGFGAYCFDTDTEEWTKAGAWTLPFHGSATRVPELYDLYFGFHRSKPHNLVALELSSPLQRPPKVLHRWPGFGPPRQNGWSLMESSLLYLGNRRFCVAKWFCIHDGRCMYEREIVDLVVVLTGVEIVDEQANKAKLQMLKHKTRIFGHLESII